MTDHATSVDPALSTQTVIEATTGAPLAAFPQRAPHAHPPSTASPTSGTARAGAPRAGSPWTDPIPSARSGAWGRATPVGAVAAPDGTSAAPERDPAVEEGDDFWLPIEEVHWDGTPVAPTPRRWWFRRDRSDLPGASRRDRRRNRGQRHPAVGLAGLLLFALLGSFFAWVSAEPLWLGFGYGERGTATVHGCTGGGLAQRCRGDFTTASGAFTSWDVRLAGIGPAGRTAGSQVPARMLGPDSRAAYVGSATGALHLRWTLGLVLILLCGLGIGWVTGALRLPGRWERRGAAVAGLAGPLLLAAGFLTAALHTANTP